jgi:probable O-glycosylation ligase (exosortase A-associated)
MREILLIAIMTVLCGIAPFRPLIGLYGYVWFGLLRPDILAWAGGPQYSAFLAVATLLGVLRYLPNIKYILSSPISLGMILLQGPMYLSVLFALWSDDAIPKYSIYIKMVLMSLLIPMLVITAKDLWRLVLVMGASMGFLGSKFGLGGVLAGGAKYASGYGGMLSDNNDIALAFAMTVPLLWCIRRDLKSPPWRMLLMAMAFFTIAGVIMTHSRGGAITLAAVLVLLVLRSRHKLVFLLLLVAAIAPVVYMVRETYLDRMETLTNPEDESSANMRLTLAKTALTMYRDHPWVGFGFGSRSALRQSREYEDSVYNRSVFHDTYLQILVDSGVPAVVVYITLLWGTVIWLEVSRRKTRVYLPHLVNIPEAIQLGLIAFSIGSAFLSRVQFDYTYMLLAAAASWKIVYDKEMMALGEKQKTDTSQAEALEAA